jgi:hypothetical protein
MTDKEDIEMFLDKVKESKSIMRKDIELLQNILKDNPQNKQVQSLLDNYKKVGFPRLILTDKEEKNAYDYLIAKYKSKITGEVFDSKRFNENEIKVLENFSHFEFGGFEDNSDNYDPIYIAESWNGLRFPFYFNQRGRLFLKRGNVFKEIANYGDGGSVGKNLKRVVRKGTKYGKLAVKKAKPKAKKIVRKLKIGFNALANKVAKSYEGKAVAPKYQKEYGKRYSKEEAKEVGKKVAAKVKRMKGM